MQVGDNAFLVKRFTSKDVEDFSGISLDVNPIHLDEEYASKTFFRKRIVHGFLVGSLISATIANKLPGKGSVYLSQEMNFKAPVYIDEEITCRVEIIEVFEQKSIYRLSTNCYNSNNKIVIEGFALIKLFDF